MERLKFIGTQIAELINQVNDIPEYSFTNNDENDQAMLFVLGYDNKTNKALSIDAFDRGVLDDEDKQVNMMIKIFNRCCAQKSDDGKISDFSKNLLISMVNYIALWASNNESNMKSLNACIEYFKNKIEEEKSKNSESEV